MQRLALFSSFIPNSQITVPRYIFYYLQQLRPHVKTLVFIYNEDFDISSSRDELLTIVDDIMPVKNEGYDFGMWQKGLQKHNAEDYDSLCLLNDSCICIGDLNYFFQWENDTAAPLTAFTQSGECYEHLQSYFLVVKKQAIPAVKSWITKQNFANYDYIDVVVTGELGLSLYANFHHIDRAALFTCNKAIDLARHAAELLVVYNIPLIKKKALIANIKERVDFLRAKANNEPATEPNPPYSLVDKIKNHRHLSDEQCHLLFDWMPEYAMDGKIYQGSNYKKF